MPSANSSDTRQSRRQHILELLARQRVRNQAELQKLLRSAGFQATQTTLSRDLRDLGVVKTSTGYELPADNSPALLAGDSLWHAVRAYLLTAEPAQNLAVLGTPSGGAQPLALALDRASRQSDQLPEILGTIAGDDNVLAVCRTANQARALVRKLLKAKSQGPLPSTRSAE